MTAVEFIEKLAGYEIDNKRKAKIERIYGSELPEIVGKIISAATKPIFFDGYRVLSFDEICEADDELNVNFSRKKIIPLIDCGDNDFIVFHFKSNEWSKFNIVDECVFKKRNSLSDLI